MVETEDYAGHLGNVFETGRLLTELEVLITFFRIVEVVCAYHMAHMVHRLVVFLVALFFVVGLTSKMLQDHQDGLVTGGRVAGGDLRSHAMGRFGSSAALP
jgi:hypothetical protein